jgi:hypothetical protein
VIVGAADSTILVGAGTLAALQALNSEERRATRPADVARLFTAAVAAVAAAALEAATLNATLTPEAASKWRRENAVTDVMMMSDRCVPNEVANTRTNTVAATASNVTGV